MNYKAEIVDFGDFKGMIAKFIEAFGSARVPLSSVLTYWHKWNETNIFGLSGPGQYEDLSENYKDFKEAAVGFIYPILKFDGVLQASLTTQNSVYSVAELYDDGLIMGTSAVTLKGHSYPLDLQHGTDNMPARPPVLKSPEQLDSLADIFYKTALRMYNNIEGLRGEW